MGVYLWAKFQESSIILTGFMQIRVNMRLTILWALDIAGLKIYWLSTILKTSKKVYVVMFFDM